MSFQDRSIQCSDCGTTFTFTAEEQEFFQSKDYTNDPKRCPSCREARKSERYGNRSYSRSTGRQMFRATCAQCGRDTEVPFESLAKVGQCIVANATAKLELIGS